MDLQEKFNILLTKFNLGKFDEVIFEATLMSKKYPAQSFALVTTIILSLSISNSPGVSVSLIGLSFR